VKALHQQLPLLIFYSSVSSFSIGKRQKKKNVKG